MYWCLGVQLLCRLLNNVLKTENRPSEWKRSILVQMFTRKVIDIQECNKYRGMKLLSNTFKLWERVTNKRLTEYTSIHESQLGFTPGRSTTDANFGMIQTVEAQRWSERYEYGIHRPRKTRMTIICVGRKCGDAQENSRSRKSTQGDTGHVPRM